VYQLAQQSADFRDRLTAIARETPAGQAVGALGDALLPATAPEMPAITPPEIP
jgi:hypothetical protein